MSIVLMVGSILLGVIFVLLLLGMLLDNDHAWWGLAWGIFSLMTIAVIIGYAVDHTVPDPSFSLRTAEWGCTSTYEVKRFNGKIWYIATECSQYSLKERP